MAEHTIHWPYKAGYNFEVEEVHLDLYRLLNQFVAEEKMALLIEQDAWLFHAVDIVGHFFDTETQRILIHAAVVARVKDDNEDESRLKLGNFETACGVLVEDLNEPDRVTPLNLREACNKIIHALRFHYDIDVEPRRVVNPIIYLYGTRGAKNWKATIKVVDFVKHYINNVC